MKLDIVIPTCGTDLADLLMTLSSCERDLRDSGFDYRYFLVGNGNTAPEHRLALYAGFQFLQNECPDKVGEVWDLPHRLNPSGARNLGAAAGDGEIIVFFDDHCKVYPDYFRQTVSTFEQTGASSVRGLFWVDGQSIQWDASTSRFDFKRTGNHEPMLHRIMDFDDPFWGNKGVRQTILPGWFDVLSNPQIAEHAVREYGKILLAPNSQNKTYRCVSSGHGSFAVTRKAHEAIGGYWGGLNSFACEELDYDLKLALTDHKTVLNPQIQHYHVIGSAKPYDRSYAEETVTAMLCVANIIGGPQWAKKQAALIEQDIAKGPNKIKGVETGVKVEVAPGLTQSVLLPRALARSEGERKRFATIRQRTLEEQIHLWKRDGILVLAKNLSLAA